MKMIEMKEKGNREKKRESEDQARPQRQEKNPSKEPPKNLWFLGAMSPPGGGENFIAPAALPAVGAFFAHFLGKSGSRRQARKILGFYNTIYLMVVILFCF